MWSSGAAEAVNELSHNVTILSSKKILKAAEYSTRKSLFNNKGV
jgi:hypothetical protein